MQQFQIKWNNHLKIFSKALSKFFEDKKFLDVILVVENGNHIIQCHKMVLAACSTYFSNIFKCNLLDDKNPVICLPSEIQLWEIQAILNYMYNGEVCISQEGLKSLVKCAEILQVKGLWRNEKIENVNTSNSTTAAAEKQTEVPNYSEMVIKSEVDIDETENQKTGYYTHSFGRKDADTATAFTTTKELCEDFSNSLLMKNEKTDNIERAKKGFNKKDTVLTKNDSSVTSCQKQFENIVCSPILYWREHNKEINEKKKIENQKGSRKEEMEYDQDEIDKVVEEEEEEEDENDEDNSAQHQMLYSNNMMIDNEEECNLLISSVSVTSEDAQQMSDDKKSSINGLYLRNPRGNQTRQYDVNSLYSALEDVRNGISIYRAAQTYNIPRKTLRNWMKRLHIKSKFPMPKQLAKAAERKKSVQMHTTVKSEIHFDLPMEENLIEKF